MLDGSGIFVDPDTGVGLSLWIDPDMQDILGLIKAIWVGTSFINVSGYFWRVLVCALFAHRSLTSFPCHSWPMFTERGRSRLTIP